MSKMWKVKEKTKFDVRDAQCIGRQCLFLGMYQHSSMLACGGARNTCGLTACCLTRVFSGCPQTEADTQWDRQVASERKAAGWRIV